MKSYHYSLFTIHYSRGASLLEVLIALAVFALTVSATLMVFYGGQFSLSGATASRQATALAHDGMGAVRALRDKEWTTLTDGAHGLAFVASGSWQLTATPDVTDGFTRTVSISTDIDGIKHVDLIVSWEHPPAGIRYVEVSGTLAPLEEGLQGDWTNPCVVGSADGDSGSKGTDVFYQNQKAYVTSAQSAVPKADFFIFNVTDPTAPTKMSSLNTGPNLKSVSVNGPYAYVIEETSPKVHVIDVSNALSPAKVATVELPGGDGRYVVVRGTYLYAGTASSSAGAEFFVLDVSTPTAPSIIGSLEISSDVNEVSVLKNTAYLATSGDTKELVVIDVSTPTTPIQIGTYNAPGTADGRAIHAKSPKRVYLGRGNSSGSDELAILDASVPSSIALRGSYNTGSSIYSLMTAGTLTFVGADDTNEEFQAYFVRDPEAIRKHGQDNLSNIGTGATYYNNHVYLSVRNVDLLQIISSCDE